jgi:DNA adenine methylase
LRIQPIPYQGSKRALAPIILEHAPRSVEVLYEPFAGSAALTLMAASRGIANHYVIGDSLHDIINLWDMIINHPKKAADAYEQLWLEQHNAGVDYFNTIRASYNRDRDPIKLLYLIARCVKNAVRFNRRGEFTQSVDKRRLGMIPGKMRNNIHQSSELLRGRVTLFAGDFKDCIRTASANDLVYMDPPYQGTTYGKDKRYFEQLEREILSDALRELNRLSVPFLLSYDGMLGEVEYGESLPEDINARRIFLNAGRSSQATLMGKKAITVESLYISACLSGGHKAPLAAEQTALAV